MNASVEARARRRGKPRRSPSVIEVGEAFGTPHDRNQRGVKPTTRAESERGRFDVWRVGRKGIACAGSTPCSRLSMKEQGQSERRYDRMMVNENFAACPLLVDRRIWLYPLRVITPTSGKSTQGRGFLKSENARVLTRGAPGESDEVVFLLHPQNAKGRRAPIAQRPASRHRAG